SDDLAEAINQIFHHTQLNIASLDHSLFPFLSPVLRSSPFFSFLRLLPPSTFLLSLSSLLTSPSSLSSRYLDLIELASFAFSRLWVGCRSFSILLTLLTCSNFSYERSLPLAYLLLHDRYSPLCTLLKHEPMES